MIFRHSQGWRSFQGFKENRRERLCILLCFGLALYRFTRANRTQSIKLCSIEFGFRSVSSLICSEIELTESLVFDFVRLSNSIELNPRIEFDFLNVRFTMPGDIQLLSVENEAL